MFNGFFSHPGGLDGDLQVHLNILLPDIFFERFRPQGKIKLLILISLLRAGDFVVSFNHGS